MPFKTGVVFQEKLMCLKRLNFSYFSQVLQLYEFFIFLFFPFSTTVCGDLGLYCMIPSKFNPSVDCNGSHVSTCIQTCGKCTGPKQDKCSNLENRSPACNEENDCQSTDELKRHRSQVNCAHTCCQRNQSML